MGVKRRRRSGEQARPPHCVHPMARGRPRGGGSGAGARGDPAGMRGCWRQGPAPAGGGGTSRGLWGAWGSGGGGGAEPRGYCGRGGTPTAWWWMGGAGRALRLSSPGLCWVRTCAGPDALCLGWRLWGVGWGGSVGGGSHPGKGTTRGQPGAAVTVSRGVAAPLPHCAAHGDPGGRPRPPVGSPPPIPTRPRPVVLQRARARPHDPVPLHGAEGPHGSVSPKPTTAAAAPQAPHAQGAHGDSPTAGG